jgi:hypothetical protein
MKLNLLFVLILLLISGYILSGCSKEIPSSNVISSANDLILSVVDLQQLGMVSDHLQQLGMNSTNGSDCQIDVFQTSVDSPLAEQSICSYIIASLNDSEVVIQVEKYANPDALNNSYQYSSQHLRSVNGLLSENDFGDLSRFYVNSVDDYGGQFDDPSISYYHLYICEDVYLIHITSKGSKDAKEIVARTGRLILSKFG